MGHRENGDVQSNYRDCQALCSNALAGIFVALPSCRPRGI